ncbi:MAG: hypothetical protein AAB558_04990 [Patescibacteria group bacterium]
MYRCLAWSQGAAVRLRVILGESGTHVDRQVLAWMFVIRILFWSIPAGRVVHLVTETRAQFELTFFLPRLAQLLVEVMELFWRLTHWSMFNPRVTILRDPDFCASNRPYQPLIFAGLFGDEQEYMEPFHEAEEEPEVQAAGEEPAAQQTQVTSRRASQGWLKVVVDNGEVPFREPQEVDEVPLWVHGVADTKTLYEGDDTDPGESRLERSSAHPRPYPLSRS